MADNLCFIDPTRNDSFSLLRGLDLQELIVQIENFYLIYRDSLGLPEDVTFGVEIEYENVNKSKVSDYILNNIEGWKSISDRSLNLGGEVVSSVLTDEKENWQKLKEVCDFLKKKHANTLNNAAGHIHVGAHILGTDDENWRKFIKLYTAYESVLFRFLYGDKLTARRRIMDFAKPISDFLYKDIKDYEKSEISHIFYYLPRTSRFLAVNFSNLNYLQIGYAGWKNTLEFRAPNATTEEVIWQNNINALTKLTLSPRNGYVDEEYLDFILKNDRISSRSELYLYDQVNIKMALEFVDLVFDNNLDKVYFLRQYFKGFQELYDTKNAVKSRKFVK